MYTNEKHVQIILSLLKSHGINKVVASPGSTNIPLVGSVQNDPYFEVFSCVDERSAAYLALGIAEASGEPVVISCTGATASRNYYPGLTEAYYRKIPIIAITSSNGPQSNGHLVAQNIDRSIIAKDVARYSVSLPLVTSEENKWFCEVNVNRALVESLRDGGGPVHIDITSDYSGIFDTKSLPKFKKITDIVNKNQLPKLSDGEKIAIFIGSTNKITPEITLVIEDFCKTNNCIVLTDHTSNYFGNYSINGSLICANYSQISELWNDLKPSTVIHIGEVSGDYYTTRILKEAKNVIRVSEDGAIKDPGRNLSYVYKGSIDKFLDLFEKNKNKNSLFEKWILADENLRKLIPELPLSNVLLAQNSQEAFRNGGRLYLGILNSLRSWNFFNFKNISYISCNVGGFGIDGGLSTAVGSALARPDELHFMVIGDLAFQYDFNILFNRHFPKNIMIILVNNGCGVEFNNKTHIASELDFDPNEFIAAGGHFNASTGSSFNIDKVSHREKMSISEAICDKLNIEYKLIQNKNHLTEAIDYISDFEGITPRFLEVLTDVADESEALDKITNLDRSIKEKMAFSLKKKVPKSLAQKAKRILTKQKT